MTGKDTDVLPPPRSEQVPPRPRSPAVLPAVMAAEGAALAVLAGLDGSAVWQAARVLVILAVTALAVWFTRRAGRAGQGTTALLLGSRARWRAPAWAARTWPRPGWTPQRCWRSSCW